MDQCASDIRQFKSPVDIDFLTGLSLSRYRVITLCVIDILFCFHPFGLLNELGEFHIW